MPLRTDTFGRPIITVDAWKAAMCSAPCPVCGGGPDDHEVLVNMDDDIFISCKRKGE